MSERGNAVLISTVTIDVWLVGEKVSDVLLFLNNGGDEWRRAAVIQFIERYSSGMKEGDRFKVLLLDRVVDAGGQLLDPRSPELTHRFVAGHAVPQYYRTKWDQQACDPEGEVIEFLGLFLLV